MIMIMANTYSQLYIQIVFAVKGRKRLIPKSHKEQLHRYMTGLIQERKNKLLAIHCMPDHTHKSVAPAPFVIRL